MKIAYFSHYFSPEIGAPSARIHELSTRWIQKSHQVDVVTCFPNHPLGELYEGYQLAAYMQERMDGIQVHRNWTYITPNKGIYKRSLGHLSFWPSARLFSTSRLKNPDVIIGTSPTLFAAMAARGMARAKDVPFVMEVRDLWPGIFVELEVFTNRQLIKILEAWELWMYRQADSIITVTGSFRDNLMERGIEEKKISVIPNGADMQFWTPRKKSERLLDELGLNGKFVVLYIGAHGVSQALDQVLDAAERLAAFDEIQFLFVGSGSLKDQLQKRSGTLGLTNVIFHDPVPKKQVLEFYSIADVCLVPLRDIELFSQFIPSKLFEILAMKKPIVASIRGEAREILDRSGGAITTDPEDSEAIAEAVLRLYQQPILRKEMGERGRQFVKTHYSRDRLAEDYLSVLSDCLKKDQEIK